MAPHLAGAVQGDRPPCLLHHAAAIHVLVYVRYGPLCYELPHDRRRRYLEGVGGWAAAGGVDELQAVAPPQRPGKTDLLSGHHQLLTEPVHQLAGGGSSAGGGDVRVMGEGGGGAAVGGAGCRVAPASAVCVRASEGLVRPVLLALGATDAVDRGASSPWQRRGEAGAGGG